MENKLFPNQEVITTEYFDIHQDWETPIPGFFIIASRKNRVSIDEFDDKEMDEFFSLLKKLRKGMRDVLNIKTVSYWQDEGTHHKTFHLWVLPRHEWMEDFGTKIQSVRPIVTHARENMVNEKVFKEVREMVKKMADYMKQ